MPHSQPKPRLVASSDILAAPAVDDPERLISAGYILRDLDIAAMTLWRLSRHPDAAFRFPPPDLVLSGKRRLWKLGTYREYKRRLLAAGAASMARR